MIPLNRTFAPIQVLVDELSRCGMTDAVTCPGSRNAPILLSLSDHEGIDARSVLDERSAGFVALGMAKAAGRPVAVTCTSGTAAANLLPAVIEARESRTPLIVLTADRPPELRGVGAGQAIDQIKLYGSAVKWFVEVGSHEAGHETAVHHRALGCRAYYTALEDRPGPVHLNFPLREPLAPVAEELDPSDWAGREHGRPWVELRRPPTAPDGELTGALDQAIADAPRGAIVCGAATDRPEAAAALASVLGWPLLAEPTSGLRCGRHDRSAVIAHYDVLLRSERFAAAHRPDVVLRIGDTPTSKPLRSWLAASRQIVIDPHASWHEPTRIAEAILVCDPELACGELTERVRARNARPDANWLTAWQQADALVPRHLAECPDPFEPKACAALADALPDGATLWVSSSMPVRDVETFFPSVATEINFLANRGANGIDGVVSSALGAAMVSPGPTVLLIGDLALIHDLGGLVAARRLGVEMRILCLNNGGGSMFDFIPLAEHADPDRYEEHVATPHPIDMESVAALAGLPYQLVTTEEEIRAALREPGLVELRTDRRRNLELHRELFRRVDAALSESGTA